MEMKYIDTSAELNKYLLNMKLQFFGRKIRIAVDIGHGARTFDDRGSKGLYYDGGKKFEEHTFNSAVGVEMKKLLEAHGFEVLLTQTPNGSYDTPLSERVRKAEAWGADLFFSIHADANGNNSGHWCFYYYTSSEGKRLAQLVSDETTKIVGTPAFGKGIYGCNPNDGWSNFYVVRKTSMLAVLHEHEFFTNIANLKKYLIVPKYQKLYAAANVSAICKYFGVPYKGKMPTPVKEENGLLGVGDTGNAVKELQKRLTALGYDTKGIDGDFGPNTNSALKSFQKDAKIDVDGIAGPATFKALDKAEDKKKAEEKAKAEEKRKEAEKKAEEARKKAQQKEEEEHMLEKAIVTNGEADYSAAVILSKRLKAPIYTGEKYVDPSVHIKTLYAVGTDGKGVKADKVIPLKGDDRYDTTAKVDQYLDKL